MERIVTALLAEATEDLELADKALRIAEEEYGMCSDEFQTLMGYRKALTDEIASLKQGMKQIATLNKVLSHTKGGEVCSN